MHKSPICDHFFPRPQVPGKLSSLTIALVVLALVLSLALLGCLIFWWRRNRQRASKDQQAEPVNLSMSGTLGSAYGHTRGAFPGPESQSLLSSRKSSTVTNQMVERAEEMMMEGRVSQTKEPLITDLSLVILVRQVLLICISKDREAMMSPGESVHRREHGRIGKSSCG